MLPVVAGVAVVNMIVTQILYFPAHKLFEARGGQDAKSNI
jgi:hypothetical protein